MKYAELKKKYGLPDWKWIEKHFFFKPETGVPILAQVRKRVHEKLCDISWLLEPLIGSGESYRSYIERSMLTAEEKRKVFAVFKEIMSLIWESEALNVSYDEKAYAAWLKKVKAVWDRNAGTITGLCRKLSEGWKRYTRKETNTTYHG